MIYLTYHASDAIFYTLQQGKPDPVELTSEQTLFSRSRVAQPPQKGQNCYFYALNMLRERIGKNRSEEFKGQREIEQTISLRKKMISLRSASWEVEMYLLENHKLIAGLYPFHVMDQRGASEYLAKKRYIPRDDQEAGYLKVIDKLLSEFVKQTQYTDLPNFVAQKHLQQRKDIDAFFLKKMGINPQEFYSKHCADPIMKFVSIEACTMERCTQIYHSIANMVCQQKYGHIPSSFSLKRGIVSLQKALEEKGPMVCQGKIGQCCYEVPPKIVEEAFGQKIWGWKKTDPKSESRMIHAVCVVGVKLSEKKGKGFVFYVDPKDGSDPLNPSVQKTYVMSYDAFAQKLCDLSGAEPQEPLFVDVGLGVHSPHQTKEYINYPSDSKAPS